MPVNNLDKLLASRRKTLLEYAVTHRGGVYTDKHSGYEFSKTDAGYHIFSRGLGEANGPQFNYNFDKTGHLQPGYEYKLATDDDAKFVLHRAFETVALNRNIGIGDKLSKLVHGLRESVPRSFP